MENNIDFQYTINNPDNISCIFKLNAAGTVWGGITGTLSDQTDLQAALDLRADKSEVDADISELDTAIQNEATTRAENDTLLQNNIDAEALARQNADTTLQGNINTLSNTVTSNYNALDARITTNAGNITSLQNTINNYGDIVTYNANNFATSSQGLLANTALQPNDNISELNNNVGYITSASLPTDYVPETRTINGYALNSNIILNYSDVGALSSSTTINDLTTTSQLNALNSGATTTNIGQIATNTSDIANINALIPAQASTSNQLADKSFVNSSIATNTAYFIGTFNSVAELEAYSGTLTNNDYAFVATTDTAGNTLYDRYKYNADTQEWLFEYELNNSSFTAQQWASINSGITSGDVALIGTALQPNDNISELTNDAGYITSASLPTVNNGTLDIQVNGTSVGTFTANQSGNTTANIVVPDSATWGNITGTLSNQTDLQSALNAKQATLVSGTNIKTINNNSILGRGNLALDGLPSQTGQSGKFLTTDGTDASWSDVSIDILDYIAPGDNISFSGGIDVSQWTTATYIANLGENRWRALAYDGTKFVALGIDGYISTSTDGTTWTQAEEDSNLGYNRWRALAYDGTKFVALGIDGYISTSTDGTTWTQAEEDSNLGFHDWLALAYDGTKFVALGVGGYISTSTDGTTWTEAGEVTNLGYNGWQALAYDGTKFVALGEEGYISIASLLLNPIIISSAITNMQTTTNLVTSVSALSTDSQYPSAKLFYDTCGNIESLLHNINSGGN